MVVLTRLALFVAGLTLATLAGFLTGQATGPLAAPPVTPTHVHPPFPDPLLETP